MAMACATYSPDRTWCHAAPLRSRLRTARRMLWREARCGKRHAVAMLKSAPMASLVVGVQVRSAYRRRGWGFTDPQQIAQCAKEGFVEKLREQAGEGCHLWGVLNVNKARARCWQALGSPTCQIRGRVARPCSPTNYEQLIVLQKTCKVCSCSISYQCKLRSIVSL